MTMVLADKSLRVNCLKGLDCGLSACIRRGTAAALCPELRDLMRASLVDKAWT